MSGMCERSAFDTFYHMDNDEKGLVIFYGFDSSIIRYDTKERLWILTIEHKPDLVATCESELTSFVLGNHDWKVGVNNKSFFRYNTYLAGGSDN